MSRLGAESECLRRSEVEDLSKSEFRPVARVLALVERMKG